MNKGLSTWLFSALVILLQMVPAPAWSSDTTYYCQHPKGNAIQQKSAIPDVVSKSNTLCFISGPQEQRIPGVLYAEFVISPEKTVKKVWIYYYQPGLTGGISDKLSVLIQVLSSGKDFTSQLKEIRKSVASTKSGLVQGIRLSGSEDFGQGKGEMASINNKMSGALDTVFQVIAEMAVNRAKSLALELAQKKLRSACEPLKSHLPNLCARIGSDPLLELLRNRNPLVEALEEDIVDFMIKKSGLPKDWKPVARELGLLLRSSVKTGKLPTEEVVIPLIESRLEDLLAKVKPAHADELRVIRVLLKEYREAGYDLDVLNWPVLRQFRLPSPGESRYVSEFSSAWQWASGVIDEKWPSKCLPNTDCKAERAAQLAELRVSPVSFMVTHPVFFRQLILFIELAEPLKKLREGSLQSAWMPRIRALLQDKDPKAQARQMIHVVYDFMKENLEEKQAPLLETLRRLSLAVLDRQPGEMLRIFIDFLKAWDPCGEKTLAKEADACRKHMVGLQKALKKSLATIQLVVGLLEEGPKDEKPDEAKKRRIQLLEEFTKTMTSRQDRAGEWILSLGVSAVMGLSYGCQYTGQDLSADLKGAHWNPPALSVPLGISVEHFGKKWGFHGMVYPFDLGQYVRTSQDEGEVVVPEPTYTNAFTFGLQLAVAYLFHDIPLTFGLDVRYIPVLEYAEKDELPDGTIQTVSPATRHVQVMLFVGFHFPLLDFN